MTIIDMVCPIIHITLVMEQCLFLSYYTPQIGNLAMETLLSLTAKSAGDWFKEELRTLGGLDHIINTGRFLPV